MKKKDPNNQSFVFFNALFQLAYGHTTSIDTKVWLNKYIY